MFHKFIDSIQNCSFPSSYKEAKAQNLNYIQTLNAFKFLLESYGLGKWIEKDTQIIKI